MTMRRRPLGRGRTLAAVAGALIVVGCVLPWWQVGGTPGIPAQSGNGFAGSGILVFLVGIATLALVAISIYARQLGAHERLSRYGLALILGGAFGNLIDRAIAGYVVDFVDVYWGEAHFWAFNVADAAITIGAILVLLEMIGIGRRHASHPV